MQKHVRFAKLLLQKLTKNSEGAAPIIYNGHLCVYDAAKGVFQPLLDAKARRLIMEHDGCRLPGEKTTTWLSNSDVKGIYESMVAWAGASELTKIAGVAFRNGFLSIEDGTVSFKPHSPENRALTYVNATWGDSPRNPFWRDLLLQRVWKDDPHGETKAAILGEFVGGCLMGQATLFKKALFLYGHVGDNGKSTIISGIRLLFDNPPVVQPQMLGNEQANASLALALINTVPELGQDNFPNPEIVKAAIAGDPLRGRFLWHNAFTFVPVAGHLIAGNTLPLCHDMSNAFWNRWILLECARTIPRHERLSLPLLQTKLKEALPEIAMWAVEGAQRLLSTTTYTHLATSDSAVEQWRLKSDQVGQFICDCLEEGSGLPLDEVYDHYVLWVRRVGHRRVSRSTFAERIFQRGIDLTAISMKDRPIQLEVKKEHSNG